MSRRLKPEYEAIVEENTRHRNANLLRAVIAGVEHDWITEAINAEDFDRIPWRIAEGLSAEVAAQTAEAIRLREVLDEAVRLLRMYYEEHWLERAPGAAAAFLAGIDDRVPRITEAVRLLRDVRWAIDHDARHHVWDDAPTMLESIDVFLADLVDPSDVLPTQGATVDAATDPGPCGVCGARCDDEICECSLRVAWTNTRSEHPPTGGAE